MTAEPRGEVQVRRITAADLDAVTAMLVRAFDDDPWMNYLATQDARRVERLRFWLRRGLEQSVPLGESYMTGGGEGVALFIPPDQPPQRGLRADLRFWGVLYRVAGPRRMFSVRRGMRAMRRDPRPERHAGLRYLAVDPGAQGRGLAGALLRPYLDRCDREGLPVGLHCTKERNVALYEHFGFTVTQVMSIPNGPRMWDMWREPGRG